MCGGIGDAIGDVVGGIGDAVGDVVGAVGDVAGPIATVAGVATGNPWLAMAGRGISAASSFVDAREAEERAQQLGDRQAAVAQLQYENYLEGLDFQLDKEQEIYESTKDSIENLTHTKLEAIDFEEADLQRVWEQQQASFQRTEDHAQNRLDQYEQVRDTAVTEAERVYASVIDQQELAIDSATEAADIQRSLLDQRSRQAQAKAQEEVFTTRVEAGAAQGATAASAGFRGIQGGTVARSLLETTTGAGLDTATVLRNLRNFQAQTAQEVRGVTSQEQARIQQAQGAMGVAEATRDSRVNRAETQFNMLEADVLNLMNQLETEENFVRSEFQSGMNRLESRRNTIQSDRAQALEDAETRLEFAEQAREQEMQVAQTDLQSQAIQREAFLERNRAPSGMTFALNTATDLLSVANEYDMFGGGSGGSLPGGGSTVYDTGGTGPFNAFTEAP